MIIRLYVPSGNVPIHATKCGKVSPKPQHPFFTKHIQHILSLLLLLSFPLSLNIGLCHGWAPASITYAEPKPITVTNADGITIPFGSSDIKAQLTYFAAEYAQGVTKFVADRSLLSLSLSLSLLYKKRQK
jgi:hypothetical protein